MTTLATAVASRQVSVLGVSAGVKCSDSQILRWLEFDFSQFLLRSSSASKCDINLAVFIEQPQAETIPPLDEMMHTPKFVCFEDGSMRYVNYQDKAIAVYDYASDSGSIYCNDLTEAYERLYLTLLSRIGEKLDVRGVHRVHSLGITYKDQPCLFLIPQGGGKTTLAMSLLNRQGVKLLSEDTPFINASGKVFPFPFRLGVTNGENTEAIPDQFKRLAGRQSGGYKVLIDLTCFADRIERRERPNQYVFCGRWTNGKEPRIVPMSKFAALKYFMRDCVFGLGLPQVIEFFLQSGLKGSMKKGWIAASRLQASIAIVARSSCYQVYLCRDRTKNVSKIVSFLSQHVEG